MLVAFGNADISDFPEADFEDSFSQFADHGVSELFESTLQLILEGGNPEVAFQLTIETFKRPGVLLILANIISSRTEKWYTYDSVAETGMRNDEDLSILESLGLVRYAVITFMVHTEDFGSFEVLTHYYHLTRLGVEFCKVCSRQRVDELKKIDTVSTQQKRERLPPFRLV